MNVSSSFLEQYAAEAASYYGFEGTPVIESGIMKTIEYVQKMYPDYFTTETLALLPTQLPGIIGGYPHNSCLEQGIDALMIILMVSMLGGYTYVYAKNLSKGHHFGLSLAVMAHCICAIIGWATRIAWSKDILNFKLLVVSYIFIIVTEYLLPFVNFQLARRIFTFQHPEKRYKARYPLLILSLGFISFVISIVAAVMSQVSYHDASKWNSVTQLELAGSITGVIFHIAPLGLTSISFAIKPYKPGSKGARTKKFPAISQPYWIQNINMFSYFVPQPIPKNTVCVMPSVRAPTNGVNELTTGPMEHGPQMWRSVLCIVPAALFFYAAALIRSLATGFAINSGYTAEYVASLDPIDTKVTWFPTGPAALWIFYGGLQTIVLIYWLVVRIDLRFYVPRDYRGTRDFIKEAALDPDF